MININGSVKHKRNPVDAVVLSLILPGLGHVYCGKLARGLMFAFLSWLSGFFFVLLILYYSTVREEMFGVLIVIGLLAIPVIATIDAYRIARRIKGDYELKETDVPFYSDENCWHVLKIIIDFNPEVDNPHIQKIILDEKSYDLSGCVLKNPVSDPLASASYYSYRSYSNGVDNGITYLDEFILENLSD